MPKKLNDLLDDPNVSSIDPETGLTLDETRREGTYEEVDKTKEIQKAFSEVAAEFAAETGKVAEETPEKLDVANLPGAEQMEFNSKFFKMYNIYFKNLIKGLNKKGAARVIERLIAYPLETEGKMAWASKNEENAFLIGNQLLEVKYLMYKYVLTEQMQKAKAEEAVRKEGEANGENKAN